jgi:hypothetical protein
LRKQEKPRVRVAGLSRLCFEVSISVYQHKGKKFLPSDENHLPGRFQDTPTLQKFLEETVGNNPK